MNRLSYKKIFHYLIILSSFLGIVLNLIYENFSLGSFRYFTHLSNLFILVVYLIMIFKPKSNSKIFMLVKYQAVVAIVLTGIVYNLLLRPTISNPDYEVNTFIDLLVHTITPLLVIIERILFSKRKVIKPIYSIYWLTFPLFYYFYILMYSFSGGIFHEGTSYESKYPYFFLDIENNGFGFFIIVIILILLVGLITYYLNNKLPKKLGDK
ncbi:MAG: Pr6Pr family membrane protein [Candidatus Izemoplasmatales bacterium]